MQTSLPGSCLLQVQLMDYHEISTDKFIGETLIDLENRWFSKKWRRIKDIPIETRDIYNPICSMPTGRVRLIVEIISANDTLALKNIISIAPKPTEEFELRVVVWEIDGCPSADVTDTSDYFVTATLGSYLFYFIPYGLKGKILKKPISIGKHRKDLEVLIGEWYSLWFYLLITPQLRFKFGIKI